MLLNRGLFRKIFLPGARAPTGIQMLDEITGGGLPKGPPTLICGGADHPFSIVGRVRGLLRGGSFETGE